MQWPSCNAYCEESVLRVTGVFRGDRCFRGLIPAGLKISSETTEERHQKRNECAQHSHSNITTKMNALVSDTGSKNSRKNGRVA